MCRVHKVALLAAFLLVFFTFPAEGQRTKSKKPSAKKPAVKKTVTSRKRAAPKKPAPKPHPDSGNYAHAWPRCSSESTYLTVMIYHKKVFTESVRVLRRMPETPPGNWVPATNGWEGLAEGAVIRQLFDALQPDEIEVYPGFRSSNSTMMNTVVLIRNGWSQADIHKLEEILKAHVNSLGYEFRFTDWECLILPTEQLSDEFADTRLKILQ